MMIIILKTNPIGNALAKGCVKYLSSVVKK